MATKTHRPRPNTLALTALALAAAIMMQNGSAAQQPAPAPAGDWHEFRGGALGFNFAMPPGWIAAAGCHRSRTCVGASPEKRGVDDYAVAFEVFAGGLEQAAGNAIFAQNPQGDWVVTGRNSGTVEHVTGDGWIGLQAVVTCGISDSAGQHAAAGECLWAVLSDGSRSVLIDTQGTTPITGDIRAMVQSVRFTRPE